MKSNCPNYGVALPQEESQIWDQFCNDHELLERLRVTPQELAALKNCSLLGTLTCKQDMLFILSQIRIATEPSSEEETIAFAPAPRRDVKVENSAKEITRPTNCRPTASVRSAPEPASLAAIARSRVVEQFGVFCWTLVLLGFLMWNVVAGLSSWPQHFLAGIGIQSHQPVARGRR
jgi:hypothetical protein